MKQTNNTTQLTSNVEKSKLIQDAVNWFMGLSVIKRCELADLHFPEYKEDATDLNDDEILSVWQKEILYVEPEQSNIALSFEGISKEAEAEVREYTDLPIFLNDSPFPSNHLLCVRGKYCEWRIRLAKG